MILTEIENAILLSKPAGWQAQEISSKCSLHLDAARKAASSLVEKGLLTHSESCFSDFELTEDGIAASAQGLPEVRLLRFLSEGAKPASAIPPGLSRFGLPNARRLGWVSFEAGLASISQAGKSALDGGQLPFLPSDAQAISSLPPETISAYAKRGLLRQKERSIVVYSISPEGEKLLSAGEISIQKEGIGAITREMLLDGSYACAPLRPYDVSSPSSNSYSARRHPISALGLQISSVFASMGFEEMSGPHVESAFWNFDALFCPQDHPARELADTFYVKGASHLPNHALVERVRHAHAAGWKYPWEEGPAKRLVLRTHTTSVSARTLAKCAKECPGVPKKFFCIGKVFRNEATDYKHLAEFFQVEGIIAWEGATFCDLLGTLKEFYAKLGFDKIRFRPSYFPYTEPSLEIEVYYAPRNTWMELGGAGIFRPEVCASLGCQYPVLAWGLSLERPLMLANKIDDIRSFYRNEIGWLRNFPMQ